MDEELIRKIRSDFARSGGLARAKALSAAERRKSAIKASKAAAKARTAAAKARKQANRAMGERQMNLLSYGLVLACVVAITELQPLLRQYRSGWLGYLVSWESMTIAFCKWLAGGGIVRG